MSLLDLVSHRRSIQFALFVSQKVPPAAAERLLRRAAGLVVRARPERVRVLEANLRQVLGPGRDQEAKRLTRQALGNFLCGYYDLFRAWNLPQEQLATLVRVPQWVLDGVHAAGAAGQGVVMVFPHVGNFDLAGQALSAQLPYVQVMTLPDPPPGFRQLNEMRRRAGADVTPLSPGALRTAMRTLRRGGAVAFGGDRPVSELDRPYDFFGRPARVPSAPVRMALRTGALVVVLAAASDVQNGDYCVHAEPFLEMERSGDEEVDVALNMRRVIEAMERTIRRWLDQWFMFVPVWPELMED
jgi:lauroyl/myristoyl acyltransferase